jgi:hypothetical protein
MQKITLTTGRVMTPMTWEVAAAATHLVVVRWIPSCVFEY